jgi:hypothetical protein
VPRPAEIMASTTNLAGGDCRSGTVMDTPRWVKSPAKSREKASV